MTKKIYLVGIKGVAMTALANIYLQQGHKVLGSDSSDSFVTDDALSEVTVHNKFDKSHITKDIDLLVYSGAYNPLRNPELIAAKELSIKMITQQQALKNLVENKKLIAVAGVGGKTTTTSMIAFALSRLTSDSGHFIGAGKISGLGSPGHWGDGDLFVAEADEYANIAGTDHTPKLLLLKPSYAVLTNIMHDHPDVYDTVEDTLRTFSQFIESSDKIIANLDDPLTNNILHSSTKNFISYGKSKSCDYRISDITYSSDETTATITVGSNSYDLKLSLIGDHNIYNATATFALCMDLGFEPTMILDSLSDFRGVGRRQEFMGKVGNALFYDDYGHHPNELRLTVKAFKDRFPDRRLWVIFESHTFTRTKALFDDFAKSLTNADLVTIMPIFSSARENVSDFNITGQDLADKINELGGQADYMTFEEAPVNIPPRMKDNDIILTMGAGFVYKLHDPLKKSYDRFL